MPKLIELRIRDDKIVVKSSDYDADLVNQIKVIDYSQRRWESPEWLISLENPKQKPDQESNLEYIRRICKANAERLGWQFYDYSSIAEEDMATRQERLIDEFIAAVEDCPCYSLKLVRWHTDTLQLQINGFLPSELFRDLYQASEQAFKPLGIFSFEKQATYGFIFNIPYRDRVIDALLKKRTIFLKYIHLTLEKTFEDGIAHFREGDGKLWFGVPMAQSDPGSINWESRDWEITKQEGVLYWVCDAQKYIDAWANEENTYSVTNFGAGYGIVASLPSQFAHRVAGFHLEKFLAEYIKVLKILPVNCTAGIPFFYHPIHWHHPLDKFFKKLVLPDELKQNIQQQKEEQAKALVAEHRAKAIEMTKHFLFTRLTKEKIIQEYGVGHDFKKSYSKQRVLDIIVTQDFAEGYLQLPKQGEQK